MVINSLDDILNLSALCGLVNSFVPGTFPTELLLNDRWSIELVLLTIKKMLSLPNNMHVEDFCEGDKRSICAYFTAVFMLFFKFQQSKAALNRLKEVILLIQDLNKVYESKAMYERDEKLELRERMVDLEKGCEKLKRYCENTFYQ